MGGVLVVTLAVLALSVKLTYATEHVVGDGYCSVAMWNTDFLCNYNLWAKQQDFFVGDTLVFNFNAVDSNVAEVTKLDYEECIAGQTPTNPKYVDSRSPATIELPTAGTFYFVSTMIMGCLSQQQLSVTVNTTSSSSSTDSPSVPSSTPSSPSSPTINNPSRSSPPSPSSDHHSSSIVAPVVGSVVGSVLFAAKLWLAFYCYRKRQKQQRLKTNEPPAPGPGPALNIDNRVNVEVPEHNAIPHGIGDFHA